MPDEEKQEMTIRDAANALGPMVAGLRAFQRIDEVIQVAVTSESMVQEREAKLKELDGFIETRKKNIDELKAETAAEEERRLNLFRDMDAEHEKKVKDQTSYFEQKGAEMQRAHDADRANLDRQMEARRKELEQVNRDIEEAKAERQRLEDAVEGLRSRIKVAVGE